MSIARWIVTLADAVLFAASLLTLIAAPLMCVLLVLPSTRAVSGERDLNQQRTPGTAVQKRCVEAPDEIAIAVPALVRKRREVAP